MCTTTLRTVTTPAFSPDRSATVGAETP